MTAESPSWVELPQFSGPLDLLLHLLDEEELSIEGIQVARVCDRYLEHLAKLERIDLDAAGEFLVMASTLLRLKSQSLLPEEERLLEEDDLDPRFELVRQLIEYRRFKRAAERLDGRREEFLRRFGRGMHPELRELPDPEPIPVETGGTSVEQLFAAFARLLRETQAEGGYVIARDDTPMSAHIERLERLLVPGSRVPFRALFAERRTRPFVVGVFLALLELIRRGLAFAVQEQEFGEIEIVVRETPLGDAPRAPGAPEPPA